MNSARECTCGSVRELGVHVMKSNAFFRSRLRIEFHHSHLPYYAELDAVRLTGVLPASDIRSKDVESHRHSRCDRHDSRRFPAFESFSSNSVVRSLHVNGQNSEFSSNQRVME